MATIKAYTDLKQARVLLKILPHQSADMSFNVERGYEVILHPYMASNWISVPCWSLAALLNVLPNVIKRDGKRLFLTMEKAGAYHLYYKSNDMLDELWETKEQLVDACYEMILKLHELKLL